jgi:predicted cupin superfamily sugar epimerase
MNAKEIIEFLHLTPLPIEGGLFSQTYKAKESIPQKALPPRYHCDRSFGTAIYYLHQPGTFSAIHRLLTDEVYHFYLGDPMEMLLLFPDGSSQVVILGQEILAGQFVQFVVPAGVWQGSHLLQPKDWALLGTTMAPGYEQDDFELGYRKELLSLYPEQKYLIDILALEGSKS